MPLNIFLEVSAFEHHIKENYSQWQYQPQPSLGIIFWLPGGLLVIVFTPRWPPWLFQQWRDHHHHSCSSPHHHQVWWSSRRGTSLLASLLDIWPLIRTKPFLIKKIKHNLQSVGNIWKEGVGLFFILSVKYSPSGVFRSGERLAKSPLMGNMYRKLLPKTLFCILCYNFLVLWVENSDSLYFCDVLILASLVCWLWYTY